MLRAGGIVLHPEERIVTVEGQRVTLTYKEFELLRLFLSDVYKRQAPDRRPRSRPPAHSSPD